MTQSPMQRHLVLLRALNRAPTIKVNGRLTKELVNCAQALKNPDDRYLRFRRRKLDWTYIAAQLAWYLRAKSFELDGIEHYASMWSRINVGAVADIHSNYGIYVFNELQLEGCALELQHNPQSRQAILIFNRPTVHWSTTRDKICTTSIQFLIRNEELTMIVTMRSNDLWDGFSYDVPFFQFIHETLWLRLTANGQPKLKLGWHFHNVGSFHVYEEHFDDLREMVKNPAVEPIQLPPISGYREAAHILRTFGMTERAITSAFLTEKNLADAYSVVNAFKVPEYNHFNSMVDLIIKNHAPVSTIETTMAKPDPQPTHAPTT